MSADSRVCALTTIWEARPFPTSRETARVLIRAQLLRRVGRVLSASLIWLDVFSNRRFEAKRFQTSDLSTEQFLAVETRTQPNATIFDKRRRKAVQEARKRPC